MIKIIKSKPYKKEDEIYEEEQQLSKDTYIIEKINQIGVYSGLIGRKLYKEIKYNKEKELVSYALDETDDLELSKEEKGGIIIISTDANATKLSLNKLDDLMKQKTKKMKNKVKWTIGYFFNGQYKLRNGKSFNEKSLSVEIIGITSNQLQSLAKDICDIFAQESILVKDFTVENIYLGFFKN